MLPLLLSATTAFPLPEAEWRWLAKGEIGPGREVTEGTVHVVLRCLQDKELPLWDGIGVRQALTSNWKRRNWTLAVGDFCLHQRYSAVTHCLFTCDRGDVAGRTGGSSVETTSSRAVKSSVVGVRLVASSAWRFWNCSSKLSGFLYKELGPASEVFPAEDNRYSSISLLTALLSACHGKFWVKGIQTSSSHCLVFYQPELLLRQTSVKQSHVLLKWKIRPRVDAPWFLHAEIRHIFKKVQVYIFLT